MSEDNGLGKGLIIGFLTGAAVGSIIALLFAPKSGKELRSDIKQKSQDFMDEAGEVLETAKQKATVIINEGKKKSEEMVAEVKEKVEKLTDEAEKILANAKEKAGEFVDDGKSKLAKETDRIKNAVKAGLDTFKSEQEA